jgi:acetyl-CoA synthetase/medium-chain acyl-CoA synthetase
MRAAVVQGSWEVPQRFNFPRDVVESIAADAPERRALAFVDSINVVRRYTFAEIAILSAHWANLLTDVGLQRGDRVLVLVGKRPEWHGLLLGALRIGAVAVPCPDLLRAKDLAFRARHSGARLLIAERKTEAEIGAMSAELESPPLAIYLEEAVSHLYEYDPRAPFADTTADEHAFILYTSGTTKDPKGVVHTHGYTFAKRMQASYWLDAQPDDLVWCTAGTGWAKSIWNVLLGPWSCGAEIVLHEGPFDPRERFELIERLGVTVLCQAPTEYRLMAKLGELEQHDLSGLRHAVAAGEPLNPEVIKVFRDAFGVTIYDGYGQTENSLLVANGVGAEVRPGSMGLPTPGHEVEVVDEQGNPVPPGVEGDIALRGHPPTLFAGYWNQPDATAAAFRGEWYLTGDRATRDEDGYFWFSGRADDVILSAAYRIGPFEVESALLEHPAVAESAVVGKPDPDRGQIVKAFVVLSGGFQPSNELAGSLQEHCRNVTAPYKYPREIEFVDELPKTRSGKIRRVELRQLEEQRAGLAAPTPVAAVEPEQDAEPEVDVLVEQAAAAEARRLAEKDAARARAAALAEAARRAEEEEERRRAEEQERLRAEAEARERAEAERRAYEEAETRRLAEEEQRRRAEAQERLRADREARERAEADRRTHEEAETRRLAGEEQRRRAEEAARQRAAFEARLRAEQEARARAEQEARVRAERDARRRAEHEARLRAEQDARRRAEEQRRLADDEARRGGIPRQGFAEQARHAEEVRRRAQEDAQRRAEEAWRALEEARRRAEAAAREREAQQDERPPESPEPRQQPADAPAPEHEEPAPAAATAGTFVSRLLAYTRVDKPAAPEDAPDEPAPPDDTWERRDS